MEDLWLEMQAGGVLCVATIPPCPRPPGRIPPCGFHSFNGVSQPKLLVDDSS